MTSTLSALSLSLSLSLSLTMGPQLCRMCDRAAWLAQSFQQPQNVVEPKGWDGLSSSNLIIPRTSCRKHRPASLDPHHARNDVDGPGVPEPWLKHVVVG